MPNVFAIGDLHLCLSVPDKTMEVFGGRWTGYLDRLKQQWTAAVAAEDLVLVPGDVSWAMRASEAAADLAFLGALPGQKVLLRGNHDYWWSSYSQVLSALPEGVTALQNNALALGTVAVAGTRGWLTPVHAGYSEEKDRHVFEREMIRLRLSLDALPAGLPAMVMLHFPPFSETGTPSPFVEVIEQYPAVTHVVYGHLHGRASQHAFEGERAGVRYTLVSADHLAFSPLRIAAV